MHGNINEDQATNEKILKYYTRISIKVRTKNRRKTPIANFLFCPKNGQKIFKIFFEKVLTIRKRYAKISFVHHKWAKQKSTLKSKQ